MKTPKHESRRKGAASNVPDAPVDGREPSREGKTHKGWLMPTHHGFEAWNEHRERHGLGLRIRACREQLGLTQAELGARLDCSKQFISAAENGQTEIHRLLLIKMSLFFETTLDYLVLGRGTLTTRHKGEKLAHVITPEILMGQGKRDYSDRKERLTGSSSSCWVKVPDDALAPTVLSGDLALADPEELPAPNRMVAVFLPQRERIWIRRFAPLSAFNNDPPYRLLSDNNLFPPLDVLPIEEPKFLGSIVQVNRIVR